MVPFTATSNDAATGRGWSLQCTITLLLESNMGKLKNGVYSCGLAAACGYSLFQKLQWPAVLSLAILTGLLYKQFSRALIESLLGFINGAKLAKFGQLEFQTDRKSVDAPGMTLKEMML
jgi:hypothetical protein